MNKLVSMAIAIGAFSLTACGNATPKPESSAAQASFSSSYIDRTAVGQDLKNKSWNSGKEVCTSRLIKESIVSNYEVHQYDDSSFIIRQHKCSSYESPFMYLLLGSKNNVLVDSGAETDDEGRELVALVRSLIADHSQSKSLLVIHSHHHNDHTAGDASFEALANTQVISANKKSFSDFFQNATKVIDLGNRELTLIKTPGHQEEALTVYDTKTQWLLTGDSVYPGLVYVKNWKDYKASITKLVEFSRNKPISHVLGAHVEMSDKPGVVYELGSLYQPEEASISMSITQLEDLHKQLATSEQKTLLGDAYIVQPMGTIQKSLSNLVRWAKN